MTRAWERRATFAMAAAGVAVFVGFVVTAALDGRLAVDFAEGLYPQAEALVERGEPLEPRGTPIDGQNSVYTILTTIAAAPLTFLPLEAARWIAAVVSIALLLGTAAVLGVRDVRCYSVMLAWTPVLSSVQTANVTPVLAFLLALAYRSRRRGTAPGALVGLAMGAKLVVVPFAAWAVALRRPRPVVALACVFAAGMLLLLPFNPLGDYLDVARRNADTMEEQALSLYVLLGADGTARAIGLAAGLAVLLAAVMVDAKRSLPLAVAACILLSPVVWLHYYALMVVPLAALRPRFGPLWALPLAYWLVPFGNAAGWEIAVALVVLAGVTVVLATRPDVAARGVPALR